jgi:hypothetical protein
VGYIIQYAAQPVPHPPSRLRLKAPRRRTADCQSRDKTKFTLRSAEMKKLIRVKLAAHLLLGIYGLLVIFHLLVLAQVVPSEIVWGGQIRNSQANLVRLETIALVVTAFFMVIVAAKVDYIQVGNFKKVINILLWIIFVYSLLNIAGNLASGSSTEKLVFIPISIVAAFLVFRLAIEK